MRVPARSDRIGKQHAIQPGVNDSITGPQRDPTSGPNEIGQGVVGNDVHWFGIGRRMAKGLHDQISTESKTGQTAKFITGHGSRGILRANGGHGGLTVLSRHHPVHSTGLAHHFLCQGESSSGGIWRSWNVKDIRHGSIPSEGYSCLGGESPSNNEGNAAPRPDFVQQDGCLVFKGGQHILHIVATIVMGGNNSLVGVNVNG
mmetsp:Transcript_2022/g.3646  ORF Transcript_2022/g.3646 Transcript_2022/m.3646 type:complete len:202 (-) Transcript_2022:462-1067(-)